MTSFFFLEENSYNLTFYIRNDVHFTFNLISVFRSPSRRTSLNETAWSFYSFNSSCRMTLSTLLTRQILRMNLLDISLQRQLGTFYTTNPPDFWCSAKFSKNLQRLRVTLKMNIWPLQERGMRNSASGFLEEFLEELSKLINSTVYPNMTQ